MEKIGISIKKVGPFGELDRNLNYELRIGEKKEDLFFSGAEVDKIINESKLKKGQLIGRINVERNGKTVYVSELVDAERTNIFRTLSIPKLSFKIMSKILSDSKRTFKGVNQVRFRVPSDFQKKMFKEIGIKKPNPAGTIPLRALKHGPIGFITRKLMNRKRPGK